MYVYKYIFAYVNMCMYVGIRLEINIHKFKMIEVCLAYIVSFFKEFYCQI